MLRNVAVLAAVLAVPTAANASVTYDLTLTDSSNPTYSGTGSISLATAPVASGLTIYTAGQYSGLSFTVDGQTFTAPPGSVSAVEFLNGNFFDITFAEQIGTSPNRYALQTTATYVFDYNDLQSQATGSITSSPESPTAPVSTPEPATVAVLGAALAGLIVIRRRRAA